MAKTPNTAGVRASLKDARSPVSGAFRGGHDPEPGKSRTINGQDIFPGKWTPNHLGLPPDCPVTPLGVDGDIYWFLDTIGQLRGISFNSAGKKAVQSLFMGRAAYTMWAWPKWNEKKKLISGVAADDAIDTLFKACAVKGPWSSVERVRGRGAWRGSDGDLVLHCGDALFQAVEGNVAPIRLGELGRNVYPTRPPTMTPWPERIPDDQRPARYLLPILRSWKWVRPEVDPLMMLGWFGVAMLGGALPWRPTVFITGDKATGKSTLQEVVKMLLGDILVQAADTSAAGIYQHVGMDSVPVAVDELEGEADPRKQKSIIKLARLASSGAVMLRGGGEHTGVEFQARSAFLFSSINRPPLEPQDLSRLALLQLEKFDKETTSIVLDYKRLELCGRQMLRILAENFHHFDDTLLAWQSRLAGMGHDMRGQRTYGVLLACADLIIGPDCEELQFMTAEDNGWAQYLAPNLLPELEDARENYRACLDMLLSVFVEAWRNGTRPVVGRVLDDFWKGKPERDEADFDFDAANKLLHQTGLALMKPRVASEPYWLAVPNQHPLVARLFKETKWGGEPAAGVWAGALRQGPRWHADQERRGGLWSLGSCRINGIMCRCTLLSLEEICEPLPAPVAPLSPVPNPDLKNSRKNSGASGSGG